MNNTIPILFKLPNRFGHAKFAAWALYAPLVLAMNYVSFSSHAETCAWSDTQLSAEKRAELILAASSLHQKYRWLVEQPANSPDETTFTHFQTGTQTTYPKQVGCTPFIQFTDAPQGIRDVDGITSFPAPISVAATWDEALIEQQAQVIAHEAWQKRKNVVLAPAISSGRTLRNGRYSEYLGEDPILSGILSGHMTNGLQQGKAGEKVVASLKHFVGNEQETDRSNSSSNISLRSFHEIYALPFDISNKIGKPGSVMCAYNQVNHQYSCENKTLLTDSLRQELGFEGFVVSDFLAVHSTAQSLKAGLDQELNAPLYFAPDKLDAAIAAGELTEQDIDRAATRVITTYIKQGLFDQVLPATEVTEVSTPASKALALKMAEAGSVLLKNKNQTLPLSNTTKTIAVIGPTASNTPTDGVSAKTACSATFMYSSDGMSVRCANAISALEAITARAAKEHSKVIFDDGANLASVTATAKQADVVIVLAYTVSGEFADKANLSLDNNGDALIQTAAAANPNTVVVLQTGSAVLMPWLNEVNAVLETWYAGEQQGSAIANLLWGDTNPSGKLPMTFPKTEQQTPTYGAESLYPGVMDDNDIRQVTFAEGLLVGYRWYDAKKEQPLFPFGYGLSYTHFEYAKLSAKPSSSNSKQTTVSFTLTNTGARQGTEIAQLYVSLPDVANAAPKRLIGWKKVNLQPNETATLTINVDPAAITRPLSVWNEKNTAWEIVAGTYHFWLGTSSRDLAPAGSVTISAK